MNRNQLFVLGAASLLLVACARQSEETLKKAQEGQSPLLENSYVVLTEDLQQLRDDFNANEGKVRLMFLSGPTCGICLRGMADLNDEFIAASQDDDRLETFVIHVPTLGAEEEHVADTIPLLDGPRVHHYWEQSGIIGKHYRDVMDVDMYVWDFWAIYGPEARWQGPLPPKPAYFEHQLGALLDDDRGFSSDKMLDAERFALQAKSYIDQVDSGKFARSTTPAVDDKVLFADGTSIATVAQPRNVAVSQYIRNRGGYQNLKRIQAVQMQGTLEVDGNTYPLAIRTARPDTLRRTVTIDGHALVAERLADGVIRLEPVAQRGLPFALESRLLEGFEFDGRLVEWPDKGHQVAMQGMQKLADVLAWKLDVVDNSGQHWHMFINSHGGDLVRSDMLDDNGQLEYSIVQSDFREISGFKYAHRIEYLERDGQSLGTEVIDHIVIAQQPLAPAGEVAH